MGTDLDSKQKEVLRRMMPQAEPAFIDDLVNYSSGLRQQPYCTKEMAEILLMLRIKDKMGATYDEIPEGLRNGLD